jgi:pimeloyl-ACP methyl ester carboxylesterase
VSDGHCGRFADMLFKRAENGDLEDLAAVLSAMSPGRAPSMWDAVRFSPVRMLFLAGSLDTKFSTIAHRLASVCGEALGPDPTSGGGNPDERTDDNAVQPDAPAGQNGCTSGGNGRGQAYMDSASRVVVVEGSGHALHIENPVAVLHEILRFIM